MLWTHWHAGTLSLFHHSTSVFCARNPTWRRGQSTGIDLRLERIDGLLWNYLRAGGESQARRSHFEVIVTVKTQEKNKKKFENEKRKQIQRRNLLRGVLDTDPWYEHFLYLQKKKNEMNCFPGTLKVMSASCSITLERERMPARRRGTGEDWGGVGLCTAELAGIFEQVQTLSNGAVSRI